MEVLVTLLGWLPLVVALLAVMFIGLFVFRGVLSLYQVVGPNEALIISGRKGFRVVKGGGTFVIPVIERVDKLDLTILTIDVPVRDVLTKAGVPVTVEAVAQIQIGSEESMLRTAAEKLLRKSTSEIRGIAEQTMAGHLRSILGTLTVEELYQQRESFSQEAQRVAASDMEGMGLKIVSFNIKELNDNQGYLKSLGAGQTAQVVMQAQIAQAEADREARIRKAAADQAASEAEIAKDKIIAEKQKELAVRKAEFERETATAEATAAMAGELRRSEIQAELARTQGAVALENQRQQALAAEAAITVAQRRQEAEIIVPANAARQAAIQQAEGEAAATEARAKAEAIRIRETQTAEAAGIQAQGEAAAAAERVKLLAQAEGEQRLAEARAANNNVNLIQYAIEQLIQGKVKIAQSHAEALGQMGSKWSITQFAGGPGSTGEGNVVAGIINDFARMLPQLNTMAEEQTGMDLMTLLREAKKMVTVSHNGADTVHQTATTPFSEAVSSVPTFLPETPNSSEEN